MTENRCPLSVPAKTGNRETRAWDGELCRHRRETDDNLSAGALCPGQIEDNDQ